MIAAAWGSSTVLVFDRLVLDVADLDLAKRFYSEVLDFDVAGQQEWEGHRTVILQLGAFHLLLLEQRTPSTASYKLPKAGPVIGLSDGRIEARAAQLERVGVDIVAPLAPSPWGERSMMIRDPDGYLIMIQEPRQGTADEVASVRPS
ncbi:MAG TPA: VOC family protein [Thermomicrobiales bacterium]|nr:VOC family protein [Thermomicrobiales bacterium]